MVNWSFVYISLRSLRLLRSGILLLLNIIIFKYYDYYRITSRAEREYHKLTHARVYKSIEGAQRRTSGVDNSDKEFGTRGIINLLDKRLVTCGNIRNYSRFPSVVKKR